jgi:hypothetical protein
MIRFKNYNELNKGCDSSFGGLLSKLDCLNFKEMLKTESNYIYELKNTDDLYIHDMN